MVMGAREHTMSSFLSAPSLRHTLKVVCACIVFYGARGWEEEDDDEDDYLWLLWAPVSPLELLPFQTLKPGASHALPF